MTVGTVAVLRGGGGLDLLVYEVLHVGYDVASERGTYGNSSISHIGEENAAPTRRGLTPMLFFYVARSQR